MKKIILLVPIIALVFFGCDFMETIVGSGDLVEAELGYTGFNALAVGSAFEVTVIHDDSYSAIIMVDDNVLDRVETYQSGQTLTLGLDERFRYTDVSLRAVITMPRFIGIDLSGAASVTVISSASFPMVSSFEASLSDASSLLLPSIAASSVSVSLSQASRADIGADASDTKVTARHASSVQLNGSSFDLTLDADDASVATLKNFIVSDTASVSVNDASEAWVYVLGTIHIDVHDASSLYYKGSPSIGSISFTGASTVTTY